MTIKILDCTLRDGGYVNNWEFGLKNSKTIVERLCQAKIDYLEVGFLQNTEYTSSKTIFNNIQEVNNIVSENCTSNIVGMIVYGKFDINKIISKTEDIKLNSIRVTFKKHEIEEVFPYLQKIKDCGYNLFINPTNIESYSDSEILKIIEKVNYIRPYSFSIVDTNGVLKEKNIQRLFYLIDNNLDNDIALCFHSHNNLQLSFSNAQSLIKHSQNRELIIDSTVFGMGRGAGNLCTELITQYINDNYNGNYDLIPILKIIDEQINPIFAKTPWGYSVPYYLAATNHCHPNYAKYLVDKQTVPVEVINDLLKAIPNNKKSNYDIELIKQIYLDNFSNVIDDESVINEIRRIFKGKKILVLASGKSLIKEEKKINEFIEKEKPFIVSLNFNPENYKVNLNFISNIKRFDSLEKTDVQLLITSNIKSRPNHAMVLNYSSYINDSILFDNVALMFLNLLIKTNIKEVFFAGLDGLSTEFKENYINENLINSIRIDNLNKRNEIMSKQLSLCNRDIKINFITKTLYNIEM